MTISAYRTAFWTPVQGGPRLKWPDKRPLDVLGYALDITKWLADVDDTIASVIAPEPQQPGLLVTDAAFSGALCTVKLTAGVASITYAVDLVVTTTGGLTEDFQVNIPIVTGPRFPTSPLLLAAGAKWYAAFSNSFPVAPVWADLPTVDTESLDGFWNNGGILSLPIGSQLLPPTPANLNLGDLWANSNVVMANGNPGIAITPGATGTPYYDSGLIHISA